MTDIAELNNVAERRFSWLARQRGCQLSHEDQLEHVMKVRGRRPDFYARSPSGDFLAEVNSFMAQGPLDRRTNRVFSIGIDELLKPIQGVIDEAAPRLRAHADLPIARVIMLDDWCQFGREHVRRLRERVPKPLSESRVRVRVSNPNPPVEASGLALPVLALPEPEGAGDQEARYAAANAFVGLATGGVLARATRQAGFRWWWVNIPVGVLVSVAGSIIGAALTRAALWVMSRVVHRPLGSQARFFIRYVGSFGGAMTSFDLLADRLAGRALWPGSGRWSWVLGWPLVVFMLMVNAAEVQTRARLAVARQTLLSERAAIRNHTALDADLAHLAQRRFAFTFVYVDLDGFKQVNDLLGHDRGDEVLAAVGRALERLEVVAYHLHGDEFAMLLVGHDDDTLEREVRRAFDAIVTLGSTHVVARTRRCFTPRRKASAAWSHPTAASSGSGGPVDRLTARVDEFSTRLHTRTRDELATARAARCAERSPAGNVSRVSGFCCQRQASRRLTSTIRRSPCGNTRSPSDPFVGLSRAAPREAYSPRKYEARFL